MGLCKVCPRFSLRTLFLGTLLTAAILQTGLALRERHRARRQEVLVADIRASLVITSKLDEEFAPRMLGYLERRLADSVDTRCIPPEQRRQLVSLVRIERHRQQREQARIDQERQLVDNVIRETVGSDSPALTSIARSSP